MRRAQHSSRARKVSGRLHHFHLRLSLQSIIHFLTCQRMPACPFTRVVRAAVTPSTSPAIPATPKPNGIPTSPASIAATMAATVVAPDQARLTTIPSIIHSTSTRPPMIPVAAFTATARPGRTTFPCGQRSARHMSRASCSDNPAGSPATACPPTTTEPVGTTKTAEKLTLPAGK